MAYNNGYGNFYPSQTSQGQGQRYPSYDIPRTTAPPAAQHPTFTPRQPDYQLEGFHGYRQQQQYTPQDSPYSRRNYVDSHEQLVHANQSRNHAVPVLNQRNEGQASYGAREQQPAESASHHLEAVARPVYSSGPSHPSLMPASTTADAIGTYYHTSTRPQAYPSQYTSTSHRPASGTVAAWSDQGHAPASTMNRPSYIGYDAPSSRPEPQSNVRSTQPSGLQQTGDWQEARAYPPRYSQPEAVEPRFVNIPRAQHEAPEGARTFDEPMGRANSGATTVDRHLSPTAPQPHQERELANQQYHGSRTSSVSHQSLTQEPTSRHVDQGYPGNLVRTQEQNVENTTVVSQREQGTISRQSRARQLTEDTGCGGAARAGNQRGLEEPSAAHEALGSNKGPHQSANLGVPAAHETAENEKVKVAHTQLSQQGTPSVTPGLASMTNGVSTVPTGNPPSKSDQNPEDLEIEVKTLMLKIRQLNDKNPQLLAKAWEEERKAHLQRVAAVGASDPPRLSNDARATNSTIGEARSLTPPHGLPIVPSSTSSSSGNQAKRSQPKSAVLPPTSGSQNGHASTVPPVKSHPTPIGVPKPSDQVKTRSAQPSMSPGLATDLTSQQRRDGTVWPADKKGTLAVAAAHWLNSNPLNKGKAITAQYIAQLLDGNPSYVMLCEILESKGLHIKRVPSAKNATRPESGLQHSSAGGMARTSSHPPNSNNLGSTLNGISGHVDPLPSDRRAGNAGTGGIPRTAKDTNKTTVGPSNFSSAQSSRPRASVINGAVSQRAMQNGPTTTVSKGSVGDAVMQASLSTRCNVGRVEDASKQDASGDPNSVKPVNVNRFVDGRWQALSPPAQPALASLANTNDTVGSLGGAQAGQVKGVSVPSVSRGGPVQPNRQPGTDATSRIAPVASMAYNASRFSSKEEAARKRNFSDFVDLTLASDDEPDMPLPKRLASNDAFRDGFSTEGVQSSDHVLRPAETTQPQPADLNLSPRPAVNVSEEFRNMDVVLPIQRRSAKRTSKYEPKTIARDVLLASGRHPEMPPLNHHLDLLRDTFRKVDLTADLSTLRWDLLDPGEPVLVPVTSTHAEGLDDADDEQEDMSTPSIRPHRGSTQRLALAEGGGVSLNVRPLSSDPGFMKNIVKKRRGRPPRNGPETIIRAYTFGNSEAGGNSAAGNPRRTEGTTQSTTKSTAGAKTPASAGSGAAPQTSGGSTPGGYVPTGYAAFRQALAADGTPLPRKKGRPFGWRKNPSQSPAASGSASGKHKAKGRPSGLREVENFSGKTSDIKSQRRKGDLEPTYQVYKCQWKGCSAELHNLSTLRMHVQKLHCKQADHGGYDCLWRLCGDVATVQEQGSDMEILEHRPSSFQSPSDWLQHVEKMHLNPLAWSLGDGPAAGLSDAHESEHSEAYLSDTHGRRVTPQITAPEQQPAVHRGPGRPRKSERDIALEAQMALEKRKREVGPGVDRGGARLATPKRRQGFVDDEDFEEIVDND